MMKSKKVVFVVTLITVATAALAASLIIDIADHLKINASSKDPHAQRDHGERLSSGSVNFDSLKNMRLRRDAEDADDALN